MDISWSYYLIALLYGLLIFLRLINNDKEDDYIGENGNCKEIFIIKLDFFLTVAICCTIATVFINIAAIVGGKGINVQSIIITLLVNGFMLLNSFSHILFSEESETFFYSGYKMTKDDIVKISTRKGYKRYIMNINFAHDIESYSNAKIFIYGEEKREFSKLMDKITKDKLKREEK